MFDHNIKKIKLVSGPIVDSETGFEPSALFNEDGSRIVLPGNPIALPVGEDGSDVQFGPGYSDAEWDAIGPRLIVTSDSVFLVGALMGGDGAGGASEAGDVLITFPEELNIGQELRWPVYAIGDAGIEIATVAITPPEDSAIKVESIAVNTGAIFVFSISWPRLVS